MGSKPNGAGYWGHLDMAGSMWEQLLDSYTETRLLDLGDCVDCAELSPTGVRAGRGGSWIWDSSGNASTVVLPSEGDSPTSYTETVAFGLSLGQVYDVAIFQAERKVESSTFRVKLRNFELGTSQCARQ